MNRLGDGSSAGVSGRYERGLLIEYAVTPTPLVLPFMFNPTTLTRTRTVTVSTGGGPASRGGYDFVTPYEAPRAAQGVTAQPESFSFTILLDATDRIGGERPDATVRIFGVQPEIDVIRAMLEPKTQGSRGASDLKAARSDAEPAFAQQTSASVLLFKWGLRVLPVFMTEARVETQAHLPSLFPYRAEASLTLQVIETENPVYQAERIRQEQSARSFAARSGLPSELLTF